MPDEREPHTCDYCGRVIGVWEPVMVVAPDGHPVRTSFAATPDAATRGRVLHERCYASDPRR